FYTKVSGSRNRERERRAGPVIRSRPDAAVMALDDRAAHGEADAHAVSLGRVEGREELLRIARIEADAVVAHRYANEIRVVELRPHEQLARAIGDRGHGIRGIRDQVQDDLLELNPIADDVRQVAGQIRAQQYRLSLQVATAERDHFPCSFAQ